MQSSHKGNTSIFVILGVLLLAAVVWMSLAPGPAVTKPSSPFPMESGETQPTAPVTAKVNPADLETNPLDQGERTEIEVSTGPGGKHSFGAVIRGLVLDLKTQEPIGGAAVTLTERLNMDQPFLAYEEAGLLQRTTHTLEDGSFSIRRLPVKGEYSLWVSHQDYAPTEGPMVRPLPAEAQVLSNLYLGPGYRVHGLIQDSAENPLQGAEVELRMQTSTFRPGRNVDWDVRDKAIGKLQMTTSLTNGQYDFPHLGQGIYTLTATLEGFATARIMPVVLMGANSDAEHDLELGTEHHLAGRVIDEHGDPIAEATVSVSRSRPRPILSMEGASNENGLFDVGGLPEGTYGVAVSCPGYSPFRMTRVQSNRTDLEFVLGRRGGVTGQVTQANGQALTRFKLSLRKVNPGTAMFGIPGRHLNIQDDNGIYLFEDLDKGTYRLLIEASGYAPTYTPGFFVDRETVRDVNVTMKIGGTIQGSVVSAVDGSPIAGASISLHGKDFSSEDRFSLFGATIGDPNNIPDTVGTTRANGTFMLRNVYSDKLNIEIKHPDFLEEYIAIQLSEGGAIDLGVVKLRIGSAIQGVVSDKSGNPIPGATVYLTSNEAGRFFNKQAVTDTFGRYAFGGLTPARYEVNAIAGKAGPFLFPSTQGAGKQEVYLRAGQIQSKDLTVAE